MLPSAELPSDHGVFDSHFLRAFAVQLPWFFRPQRDETCFTQEDFTADFRCRFNELLKPRESGMDFEERHVLFRHLLFTLIKEGIAGHAGRDITAIEEQVRHDLNRIHRLKGGVMVFPHYHPLYNSGYGNFKEAKCGAPVCVVPSTGDDRKLAKWLDDGDRLPHLLTGVTEYMTLSPQTRVVQYASQLRKKLHSIVARCEPSDPDETWRLECIDCIVDEWVVMRSHTFEGVRDHLKKAGISDDPLQQPLSEVLSKILTPRLREGEDVKKWQPLLEELTLAAALNQDDEGLVRIATAWEQYLRCHNVPCCDNPGIGVAILAGGARHLPLSLFHDRLGEDIASL